MNDTDNTFNLPTDPELPDVRLPQLVDIPLPDIALPPLSEPDFQATPIFPPLPKWDLPAINLTPLPEWSDIPMLGALPEIDLPNIRLPDLPKNYWGVIRLPDLPSPDLPDIRLPDPSETDWGDLPASLPPLPDLQHSEPPFPPLPDLVSNDIAELPPLLYNQPGDARAVRLDRLAKVFEQTNIPANLRLPDLPDIKLPGMSSADSVSLPPIEAGVEGQATRVQTDLLSEIADHLKLLVRHAERPTQPVQPPQPKQVVPIPSPHKIPLR